MERTNEKQSVRAVFYNGRLKADIRVLFFTFQTSGAEDIAKAWKKRNICNPDDWMLVEAMFLG